MTVVEQSFVEQVLAGDPSAIGKLMGIIITLIAGLLLLRWFVKTAAFKVTLGVLVLLIIAGFIMDAEAMMRSVSQLADWLQGKSPEE